MGSTRTIISAEAEYQMANKGYYGTMACLRQPADCIPGYAGKPLLDANFDRSIRAGYTYEPGQPPYRAFWWLRAPDDKCYAPWW